jgi:hypothetical protein
MALGLGLGIPFIRRRGGEAPFQGLLDLYPNAAAAYSLRKLRAAHTGSAVRIRRSSDNAESDIGFLNNEFDSAAAQTFCGAGNGFITTWYDQSGNGLNATQTTAANQYEIISSGVIYTNVSGKPCINGIFSSFLITSAIINNAESSLYSVFRTGSAISASGIIGAQDSAEDYNYLNNFPDGNYYFSNGAAPESAISAGLSINNNFISASLNISSTNRRVVTNGASIGTSNTNKQTNFTLRIGSQYRPIVGQIAEIVIWGSGDTLATAQAKQTEINNYYGIY